MVSAQIPPQACALPCAPGFYCSFGQCIPLSGMAGGSLGAGGVIPPGAGQFGAPCPRRYRMVNNACILTGSAYTSFKMTQIGWIMLIGVFL